METKILNKVATVELPTKAIDPKEFFQDRNGLFVWSIFEDNIVSKAEKLPEDKEFKLDSFDLTEDAYDEDIEKPFEGKHIFSETDVCAVVASLIEKQAKGEDGPLLTNGYANLFYTSSRVVDVRWRGGGWSVHDWSRVGEWLAGTRVFSPATDS